jgi:hypothetical protein
MSAGSYQRALVDKPGMIKTLSDVERTIECHDLLAEFLKNLSIGPEVISGGYTEGQTDW